MIVFMSVTACNNNVEYKTIDVSMDSYYADETLLNQLSKEGYVDYRISRYFACAELTETVSDFGWSNISISKRPIIIYNSITDEPKYYEFRVLENGKEVGAISCVANELDGSPVKYILPFANEVKDESVSRSIIRGGHFIDSGYPSKLSVKVNTSRAVSVETGYEISELETDVSEREFLENISQEMLEDLGLTSQEKIDEYLSSLDEVDDQLNNLWEEIENNVDLILEQDCDEILSEISSEKYRAAICQSTSEKILLDWDAVKNWYYPGGYCGPNCVGFILLGLGTASGFYNVPLQNSRFSLTDFYQKIENGIGKGPKLFCNLRSYMSENSDYTLKTDFGHLWNTIIGNIDEGKPSISLRSSKSITDLSWHYRVIYGYKINHMSENKKFLWWSWTKYYDNCFYIMHDNGSDGKNFYEARITGNHIGSAHVEKK